MLKEMPEVSFLLTQVEKRFKKKVATTTDFNILSAAIEMALNERISSSTLKRLWGYVASRPMPRFSTLSVLARYIGYKDYEDFCSSIDNPYFEDSGFLSSDSAKSADLKKGDTVTIGWSPNRLVTLEYLGDFKFMVMENRYSKLREGDIFEAINFIKGQPLYVSKILRGDAYTPPYIAGRSGGLTSVTVNIF